MFRLLLIAMLSLMLMGAGGLLPPRLLKHKKLFKSYPEQTQALIRARQIERGFDSMQVILAIGKPDQKDGGSEGATWLYLSSERRQLKHEKGAIEYENEMLKYREALNDYKVLKEAGKFAIAPIKPDPYRYTNEYRTKVERRVRFKEGVVTRWEEPGAEYLDDWH